MYACAGGHAPHVHLTSLAQRREDVAVLHIGRVGDGKGFPLAGDIRVRARRRRAQALDVLRARGHDFRSGAGELLIPAFQRFQVACAQKLVALLECARVAL